LTRAGALRSVPRVSDVDGAPSAAELVAVLDDGDALARVIARLPSIDALVPLLVSTVPEATLTVGPFGHFEPREALALGRPGLWLATALVQKLVPRIRTVPSPDHERWDAVIELYRERPEAPWMVGALLATMRADQERLGSRTLLGVTRRFGMVGWDVLERATVGAPLEELVRRRRPAP
jgi:hypothetical protein